MEANLWSKKIKANMKKLDIYEKPFDPVIDTLSDILEQRDAVFESFKESMDEPITEYTNKGGQTNKVLNPKLKYWNDLNATALNYWKELGLTANSLKKIKKDEPKEEPKLSGLAAAIASLE